MKMYLRLVSALIQGVEPSDKEKKRNKVFYVVMSIIAGFGIMLPMTFFVGVIIYALTGSLKSELSSLLRSICFSLSVRLSF